MYEYSVTIGRNVSDAPMHESIWVQFQDSTEYTLTRDLPLSGTTVERAYGAGEWEGITEDNARIVARTDSPLTPSQLDALRNGLALTAALFGQDALALTIGTSELVPAL